jgi:hypothetical protein
MPRLIVTGSRKFTDAAHVRQLLAEARELYGPELVVVEGEAPGADRLARAAAYELGLAVDRVPADWTGPCRPSCKPGHRRRRLNGGRMYCPAAGVYRNQAMLEAGADAVIALLVDPAISPCDGTRDMMQRAQHAGIPVAAFPKEFASLTGAPATGPEN